MSVSEAHAPCSFQYLCPDCKGELHERKCGSCGREFGERNGIPVLLPTAEKFGTASQVSATYDAIYANHSNVWEDQGRAPDFIGFFARLVAGLTTNAILEVGCGEGILLAELNAQSKAAIDVSSLALRKTRQRTTAKCAVAIAERLPYPSGSFDAVVSVGVMEHFFDDREATTEICRVLKPGGHYIALIHTKTTTMQSVRQKFREFVFPKFRPVALTRWIAKKLFRPIHQPLHKHYTVATGRSCMEESGLVVERVISCADRPRPPLAGPHVVIYICRK